MKYDVFVSYSRNDSDFSDEICHVLNAYKQYYSFSYFIDREAVTSKHDYLKRISEAIAQSKTMLFLASKNSTKSDFCSKELLFADKRNIVIHQYRIDNSVLPNDIEMLLGTHHYRQASDFSIEDMVQEVLSSALGQNIESLVKLKTSVDDCRQSQVAIMSPSQGNQIDKNEGISLGHENSQPQHKDINAKETEQKKPIDCRVDKRAFLFPLPNIDIVKTLCLLIVIGFASWVIFNVDFNTSSNQESPKMTIIPPDYQAKKAPKGYFDVEKKKIGGFACVSKDSLWGFINEDRLLIIPLVFEDVFAFNEGLAQVKYNGKWGFVDTIGNIVVEPQYESVSKFVNGFAGVEIDGKFGFINKSGDLVIPAIYDNVWAFSEGKAKVWMDEQSFYITTTGERIE